VLRVLPLILILVLSIYCWIEIAQSEPRHVRQLPRGLWALLVCVPLIGPVAWLVYGRPNGTSRPPAPRPAKPRPLAPDDDPDFLRRIKRPPGDEDPTGP
jgi:hypothetical protein